MCSTCPYDWKCIKAVLVDISGTLHIEDTVIEGAVEALERLRGLGVAIRFVTNTTKESTNVLYERLLKFGFRISKNDIYSSLTAARKLAEERKLNPLLLVDPAAEEEFAGLGREGEKHNAVLVGLAPSKFDYANLNQAFRLILDDKVPLIAIHKAKYYKRTDGLALGPGPFVAALEYATGVEAEVVGKPTKAFFLSCLEGLDVELHETVMIGDDVKDDIDGAIHAGLVGILVKTGKYRDGDHWSLPCGAPYAIAKDFPHAVNLLEEYKKSK